MRSFVALVVVLALASIQNGVAFVGRAPSFVPSSKLRSIKHIHAREIIDSRGYPTVEVTLQTDSTTVHAAVPSGASTGTHEACELRDGGDRYFGKGVQKAVNNVQSALLPALVGKDETNQAAIDNLMISLDGTPNKSKIGANAILGVSLAVAKAAAVKKQVPLFQHIGDLSSTSKFTMPVPSFNVINGGSHAGNGLAFQEFMILPVGAETFKEAMQIGCEIYQSLKKVTKKRYGQDAVNVGDEGGFAPPIKNNQEGIELLMDAIHCHPGYDSKVVVGMDVASSEFFIDGRYDLAKKSRTASSNEPTLSGDELANYYQELIKKFPSIVSIEDPFDQDDWGSWVKLTSKIGNNIQIVGDDLTVTNPSRIQSAASQKACNALLLKVNQIGTLTEAIDAVRLAKNSGWGVMTSHRSGETEDTTIADVAVGLCTGQIKTGAPCRSERLAKYNQLLRIEESLGSKATYAGRNFRKPEALFK